MEHWTIHKTNHTHTARQHYRIAIMHYRTGGKKDKYREARERKAKNIKTTKKYKMEKKKKSRKVR